MATADSDYTIALAIDTVVASQHAINHAFNLAKRLKVSHKLYILHVAEETQRRPSAGPAAQPTSPKASDREIEIYSYLTRVFHNEIEYELISLRSPRGRVAITIEDYIKTRWPRLDLLVIGTRAQSGLKKLMLGSVSEHCIQTLSCPVMVVKNPS